MKKFWTVLVALCAFGLLSSCASSRSLDGFGHGSIGGGSTLASGNWAFSTSGTILMGGTMNVSNTTVTGDLYVVGGTSTGFLLDTASAPMAISGTFSGGTLKFSGTINSSTITVTFTGINTSSKVTSLSGGTYTVSGGTDTGDSGSISAVQAGSFSGTWKATLASGGTVTLAMTEATAANANGKFLLTPSTGSGITFTGVSGCTVTGSLVNDSFAAGDLVLLDVSTTDQGVAGTMAYLGVGNSATTPTVMNGTYAYIGGSTCMMDNTQTQTALNFTKQ